MPDAVEDLDIEDVEGLEASMPLDEEAEQALDEVAADAVGEDETDLPDYDDLEEVDFDEAEDAPTVAAASRGLGLAVDAVLSQQVNSLARTEVDVAEARAHLTAHRLRRALKAVLRAERALEELKESVLHLRRSMALLHRLLKEKQNVTHREVEHILMRLRDATSAAEVGEVGTAASEVEGLVDDLIGGDTTNLNPFLFRHFWLGIDTRWPAGGDMGVMIVRIINDGAVTLPMMRMHPPVPEGWFCDPEMIDVPSINPGGNLPVRFEVTADRRYGADEIPLSRKLALTTGYEMRSGDIVCTVRAQNRALEPLVDILIDPWFPPGYTSDALPMIPRLEPDEVATIRIPLRIDIGGPRAGATSHSTPRPEKWGGSKKHTR